MSLSILQKPDQLGSPPARLVIGCGAGVTLGTPPDGRGEAVKPLGRLQLQIRTLTQRFYQLGTGEKESFRHARERGPVSRNTGLGGPLPHPSSLVGSLGWFYYLIYWLFGLLLFAVLA